MQQINNRALIEISQKSPTAEDFFAYASARERNVRDGISRLPAIRAQMTKEGFNAIPQDLLSMFRELERAGVGELKGENFRWNVPIRKIGEATEKTPAPKPLAAPRSKKTLVVCLGEHKEVAVSFTPNLTSEDIRFLADKLLNECK